MDDSLLFLIVFNDVLTAFLAFPGNCDQLQYDSSGLLNCHEQPVSGYDCGRFLQLYLQQTRLSAFIS